MIFLFLHTGVFRRVRFRGRQNMECAVLPPSRTVASIPLDVTARANILFLADFYKQPVYLEILRIAT